MVLYLIQLCYYLVYGTMVAYPYKPKVVVGLCTLGPLLALLTFLQVSKKGCYNFFIFSL